MGSTFGRRFAASVLALGALFPSAPGAAPAAVGLLADGECNFPAEWLPGKPWALQRVLLDQLWLKSTGRDITVAVIDTGVDAANPQLAPALAPGGKDYFDAKGNGGVDTHGHGSMAAGIIAARPGDTLTPKVDTGFVGLAPDAKILSIRQNGGGNGEKGDELTLAKAVREAADGGARVINISQDTEGGKRPGRELETAVRYAIDVKKAVVIAAAGNSGDKENLDTWPAAYPGVLAVGASDRNNERAAFSQNKPYVGVLAPGVDMWSTVPGGGHCRSDGTSFAAPYVAGVAALVLSAHPDYSPAQVITLIQQTAQRSSPGPVDGSGWGVVDPLKALTADFVPGLVPVADTTGRGDQALVHVEPISFGPTRAERDRRQGTVILGIGAGATLILICGAFVLRDARARRGE